jgi:ABC-type amino acid transport substrate-binding protein
LRPLPGVRRSAQGAAAMEMKPPSPLTMEHQALMADLNQARHLGGHTGTTADRVGRLMQTHIAKEEQFALPPLSLLQKLAEGRCDAPMLDAVDLAERLEKELPNLLAEHRMIVAALEELMAAATKEGHTQIAEFAEKVMLHTREEELVTYPAAILVGKYVKMRIKG